MHECRGIDVAYCHLWCKWFLLQIQCKMQYQNLEIPNFLEWQKQMCWSSLSEAQVVPPFLKRAGSCQQLKLPSSANLKKPCVCACWSDQPKLCWSVTPRAQPLQSKPSIIFWNSLWEWLPDDRQGPELGHKFELCLLANTKFQNFNQLQNPWINYVEFEFILGPMEKQRPEVSGLKPLSLW